MGASEGELPVASYENGFGQLLSAATSPTAPGGYGPVYVGPLVWTIGDRVLYLGPRVFGLVELGLILAVAAFAYGKFLAPDETERTTQG